MANWNMLLSQYSDKFRYCVVNRGEWIQNKEVLKSNFRPIREREIGEL